MPPPPAGAAGAAGALMPAGAAGAMVPAGPGLFPGAAGGHAAPQDALPAPTPASSRGTGRGTRSAFVPPADPEWLGLAWDVQVPTAAQIANKTITVDAEPEVAKRLHALLVDWRTRVQAPLPTSTDRKGS